MSLFINIISLLANFLSFLIIIHVLLTWIPHNRQAPAFRIIHQLAEMLLAPLRFIPSVAGMDLSPILFLLGLQLIEKFLINFLQQLL